jgi:Uma2 family endonuclease
MAIATHEITQQIVRRTFTVDQYHAMGEAGIFQPDDRIELIRGEVLEMLPIGASHVGCVGRTTHVVTKQIGNDYFVLVQCPIRLSNDSEPEPDFLVVRMDYDQSSLPTPSDALLVIEVSDSSLAFDRHVKLPLYARAGIPEAWLFNLTTTRIERHTDPSPDGYRSITIAVQGEALTSVSLPALTISVDAVLATPAKPEKKDE